VRAKDKKEAREACSDWINSHLEGSAFDYGGPSDDEEDPEFKTVLQCGDEHFMPELSAAVEAEKASIREHWAVVKQFVLRFLVRDDPPPDDRSFMVTRVVAQGIEGVVHSGREVTYKMSVHEGLLHVKWLHTMRHHVEYRCYMESSDACLFVDEDVDVNIDDFIAGKAKAENPEELFLVRTNLHH
jgi:hypothetical protein